MNKLQYILGPAYHPLRDSYLRIFKPTHWQRTVGGLRSFYGQYVKSGDTVFDVGANIGEHTRCFVGLGAKVVSIEPQPKCIEQIRKVYPRDRVTVVPAAAGAAPGVAKMKISDVDVLSSLSDTWLDHAKHSKRYKGIKWDKEIEVPIVTLDQLIKAHGMPSFIKIDVEGFEPAVFSGLSALPPYLSFEFNSECIDLTMDCLNTPCLQKAQFNYYREDTHVFLSDTWINVEQMKAITKTELAMLDTFGDIIVRSTE